jgi:hypothetical protein
MDESKVKQNVFKRVLGSKKKPMTVIDELHQVIDSLEDINIDLIDKGIITKEDSFNTDNPKHVEMLGGSVENAGKVIRAGKKTIDIYNEIMNKGGLITADGRGVLVREMNNLNKIKDGILKADSRRNVPTNDDPFSSVSGNRATNFEAAGASPIEVNFECPVKSRTYGDYVLDYTKDIGQYPMVLQRQVLNLNALFGAKTDKDGYLVYDKSAVLANFVNTTVSKLNNLAQIRVNFTTEYTYEEISLWLSILCDSLNAWFGITSIIQFTDGEGNNNYGMNWCRRNMSAEDMNEYRNFSVLLQMVPCPPILISIFYMLNHNYRYMSDLPKSTILKFTSACAVAEDDLALNFGLPDLVRKLTSKEFVKVQAKLVRTIPEWRDNKFPVYGSGTVHSPVWNSIWSNAATITRVIVDNKEDIFRAPLINSDESPNHWDTIDQIYYAQCNELNGLVEALYAVYEAYSDQWITGIFRPKPFIDGKVKETNGVSRYSNRWMWVNNTFIDAGSQNGYVVGKWVHSIDLSDRPIFVDISPDFENIHGLSVNTIQRVTMEVWEWIVSLDNLSKDNINKPKGSDRPKDKRTKPRKPSKNKRSQKPTSKEDSKAKEESKDNEQEDTK